MESFAASGRFWLPRAPDRRVHGDLAFDGADIELRVHGPLRGPVMLSGTTCGGPEQWVAEPMVHGRLRTGEKVTLLEVSGNAWPVDVAEERPQTAHAGLGPPA